MLVEGTIALSDIGFLDRELTNGILPEGLARLAAVARADFAIFAIGEKLPAGS